MGECVIGVLCALWCVSCVVFSVLCFMCRRWCGVCCVYEPTARIQQLSCGCRFCKPSISQWVFTQLEHYYRADFVIMCPQGTLGHVLTETDIRTCLSAGESEVYDNYLLRRALLADPSFKFCPTKGCAFAGWVSKSLRCRDKLVCESCGSEWTDPSLRPALEKAWAFVCSLSTGHGELWSYTWKELWAKHCPKCASPIEKNGGCYHMTCQHCNYEFCWYCMQSYYSHDSNFCSISLMIRYGLFAFFLLMICIRVAANNFVLSALLWFVSYYLFTVAACGITVNK